MNLCVLAPSRQRAREGDVFAMRPPDGRYVYGRVIDVRAKWNWGGGKANLIYVYAARSNDKLDVPVLLRDRLLLPPMMTNNLPWRRGYFEPIERRELGPFDRLPMHSF